MPATTQPSTRPPRHHAVGPDFASIAELEPLRAALGLRIAQWPHRDSTTAREPRPDHDRWGARLKVVAQARSRHWAERSKRGFLRASCDTRGDWHDLLNCCRGSRYRGEGELNARHYAALRQQLAAGATNRGPAQDALTLFDEGGVIVASADDALTGYLRGWRWKELFWDRRALLLSRMRFYLFGHALYEKALRPFTGITGRGILWKTGPEL